jgi:RNA polymerase subunit RPABC4/transcription elongation factor Spt4
MFRAAARCNDNVMKVRTPSNECGREADETADGWRAYLAVTDESDEELEVDAFCPECASREFEESPPEADT